MSSLPADGAPDTDQREPNLGRDVGAIVLIAVTLILTVSILTRDPADPIDGPVWPLGKLYQPDVTAYPTNSAITNACGYWGALLSQMLFDAIGLASAVVVAAGGGIATALLTRGRVNAPVLRSLGGCVIVVGVSTAAGLYPARWIGMPVVGNGGYLGAMTSTWLSEHFAPVGAWILALTVLAVGLLMATDYALLYAGKQVARSGATLSRQGLSRAAKAMPIEIRRRRRPFTDVDEPIVLDGELLGDAVTVSQGAEDSGDDEAAPEEAPHEPKIKFHSKKLTRKPADTASEGGTAEQDSADPEDWGEEYSVDDEVSEEPAPEPVTREIEVDSEPVTLRQDEAHPVSNPKVKLPTKKPTAKEELYQSINDSPPSDASDYLLPSVELLEAGDDICYDDQLVEVRRKAQVLEETFRNFGFNVRVVEIETGPVIAQYEIELEAGLRLSKISGLADDIAIALRVPSVRIVAPIPGKNTVGIEVPNESRQVVYLRDVIEESDTRSAKMNIPVFLGKDVSGNPMVVDLAKMPHLLIAGRTGTGKSVCLNAIISSVLMTCKPDEVRMLMIDPKMVELSGYGRLPHLMHPVITDMKKAEAILAWAVDKMEERYSLLAKVGVRHINSFNDLGREEVLRRLEIDEDDAAGGDVPDKLPFIVIVADEMADLMMTAGKDVEQHIIRLAQKSRAVGIHLILATQKPTVDVITGLIKSNLPARLSFQVASKTDSRVVLDENGADKLLGNGDMLFLWPGTSTLIRGQGTYLSDDEIDRVCDHCSTGEQSFVGELMNLKVDDGADADDLDVANMRKKDELYESAIEVVIREGRGSLSLIQRCLGIGYGRAARLVDYMAEDGIVGEYNGAKSREVLITMDQWLKMQGLAPEPDEEPEGNEAGPASEPASGEGARSAASVQRTGPGKPPTAQPRFAASQSPAATPAATPGGAANPVAATNGSSSDSPGRERHTGVKRAAAETFDEPVGLESGEYDANDYESDVSGDDEYEEYEYEEYDPEDG